MIKKFVSIVIVLSAIIATTWGIVHRQFVRDWYIVHTTVVQPAALTLEPRLDLTPKADFLYKASQPEILNGSSFNKACESVAREQSIVLGCYTQQHVYVYNVTDNRLQGVQEVTASHELLHAVYDRMSPDDKKLVNTEVEQAAAAITDPRLAETIAEYKKTEPGQVDNELHSILGTEYGVLPEKLEAHYAQYFTDRAKIVAFSDAYQKQFTDLENQIKSYDHQRTVLRSQIEDNEKTLSNLESQLNTKQNSLSSLRSSDVNAYNAQVPAFNALVARYNSLVKIVSGQITQYNQIVVTRNSFSTILNNLTEKLDSTYSAR